MKTTASAPRAGITLVEVLVAIFTLGVGLLALLTLFPLGALEMAQAVKDDRAAKIAVDAVALSEEGQELVARTRNFVVVSAISGSADPQTVVVLRADYEDLGIDAANIELQLRELRPSVPNPKARRLVDRLLVQIRSIKLSAAAIARLLGLLGPNVGMD